MPWIQDKDLETQRRGADDEVCKGEPTREPHWNILLVIEGGLSEPEHRCSKTPSAAFLGRLMVLYCAD